MILLIDSYDSFSNNLAQLIVDTTGKKVVTIHNDTFSEGEYENFFELYLPLFDYIVIGPGPGHPSNPKDIGIVGWLLQKYRLQELDLDSATVAKTVVPILGICLGLQSLCFEFGNEVRRLECVKHGQVYDVVPVKDSNCGLLPLFKDDCPAFPSVRYHSLYVDIDTLTENMVPLAFCEERENGTRVLMAARHVSFPFYGVQYHPESICSQGGDELVASFDAIAAAYNEKNGRKQQSDSSADLTASGKGLLTNLFDKYAVREHGLMPSGKLIATKRLSTNIYIEKLKLSSSSPIGVCDYFYNESKNGFILLNSASVPGEWSIIGLPTSGKSEVITHSVDEPQTVHILKYGTSSESTQLTLDNSIWSFVGQKFEDAYIPRKDFSLSQHHIRDLPFLGGYLGIISYEEGQHVVFDKLDSLCHSATPDLKLVYIERFIILDHVTNDWFIVSINQDETDQQWCSDLSAELIQADNVGKLVVDKSTVACSVKDLSSESITFELPSKETYTSQFNLCQEYLHSGDSYELCLTTQLKISLPTNIQPWDIYKVLTIQKNPSPFSCFMEFDDMILISSSPERFLLWKDQEDKKMVELRPIKGTVKKSPEMTYEAATKILKTPKEMGENLMIVDLIRHDLHQFISKVTVDQLMAVEEYETVYQLVSVIRGELVKDDIERPFNGLDILHDSLPPGSMTGAPKKRSVQLLQDIEAMQKDSGNAGGRRGIYSGVVGYWSVTDDSDWSVIIRSTYHYRDDKENDEKRNLWRIGAGGAITVLSDLEGEWEEMHVKLTSALQAFK